MTSETVRRVAVPLAVAVVVLAIVLTVVRLAASDDDVETSTPGSSGSGGGASGSTGTGVPSVPSDPSPTIGPDPVAPTTRFTSVRAGSAGSSLEVTFWGGVEKCYDYTVQVEEKGDAVTLSLTEERTFDGPCIELAMQYDRTVPLDAPLGMRRVVDAQTGQALLGPSP